jgi:hypothetical protein
MEKLPRKRGEKVRPQGSAPIQPMVGTEQKIRASREHLERATRVRVDSVSSSKRFAKAV